MRDSKVVCFIFAGCFDQSRAYGQDMFCRGDAKIFFLFNFKRYTLGAKSKQSNQSTIYKMSPSPGELLFDASAQSPPSEKTVEMLRFS